MNTTTKVALAALGGLALYNALGGSEKPPKSIEGKVILVTGSATGIGKELAFLLAKEGVELVLVDINLSQLEATAEEVRKVSTTGKVHTYQCDISARENVYAVAKVCPAV